MDFHVEFSDDDEDGDYSSQWSTATRDGLMFLIDCSEAMFQKQGDQSPFELAMKCAQSVIKNKILGSERDFFSIIFYSTEKDKNSGDFKNVYVLQDLDQPSAERVLQVQGILEGGTDKFISDFGTSKTYSLADALWACAALFTNCTKKLGSRRIMLFTNNDNPHGDKPDLQRQAKKKAEDLRETGIELELMHITKPGQSFDFYKFYKDCVYAEDEDTLLADPAEKFEELLTRVRAKDHKKRATGRVTMSLGKGLDMSVGIYNLVRTCPKPTPVKLFKKTNEQVNCWSKTLDADTNEVLGKPDLKRAAEYEGKKVCFDDEELNEMKKLGPVGVQLLGFKPREKLKRYHHVRAAQFLYPDEGVVRGSCTMFSALLRKCLDRNMVAICLYMPRKNLAPRYVALLPQEEELDERKVQITPPGFHVIFLPFADDFRALKIPESAKATEAQIEAAKAMVKKLSFPFKSESFENPSLQKHYVNLEAMALDMDKPDEMTDYTDPDVAAQLKRAGREVEAFRDLVFPEGYSPSRAAPSSRKRAEDGGGTAAKRTKVEAGSVDVEAQARAGTISKLTVAILKDYVKAHNIKSGTKKAELIDAITDHLGL